MRESSKLDLRGLRYVLAIAETGSFARAAARLGITQPALSRSIGALERTLGVRLFDRGRSGTVPTAFGRLLVERGGTLLRDAGSVERELSLLKGTDVGSLAVGVGAYPADICVGGAAARLVSRHPGIHLRIVIGGWPELIRRVLAEELDLAICDDEAVDADERLVVEALPRHPGRLFCRVGHPLLGKATIDMDAVRKFPVALTALAPRASEVAYGQRRDGHPPAPQIHVDTFELARQIVLGSDAIGAAVFSQIAEDVAAERLVVLPIERPWISTRYAFIHRSGRTLAPAAKTFMAIVRQIEDDLSLANQEFGKRGFAVPATHGDAETTGPKGLSRTGPGTARSRA